MAIANVQDEAPATTTNNKTCAKAFTANVAAGNMITVRITAFGLVDNQGMAVSDTLLNNYQQRASREQTGNNAQHIWIYEAKNITGGACTVTCVATAIGGEDEPSLHVKIDEWSGCDTTSPFDTSSSGEGTSGTADSGNTAVTSQANELLIGVAYFNGVDAITQPADWTEQYDTNGRTFAYRLVLSTSAYKYAPTSTSNDFVSAIATYKEATSSAQDVAVPSLMLTGVGS